MHRPLEVLEAQDVREVQQGSCQGRDRYAFVDGDLVAAEPAGAVDAQALAADPSGPGRNRDVHEGGSARTDIPVRRRIDVREHRPGAARQDGGQPVPLAPELPMADGENASVEAKEAVGADALLYACVADARLEHLSAGHDSVLPSGDGRQAPVRRGLGAFSFHLTR